MKAAKRPMPPEFIVADPSILTFVPAPDLPEWIADTFLAEASRLFNPDHVHLAHADVRFLWSTVPNARQMRVILGQCELGQPRATMGKWPKARMEQQLMGWFGAIPDFLITLDANYCVQAGDIEFCALVEHELYHAGQERDEFGLPKFTREGRPKFAMRGHDVEEFIGVVRRYGATSPDVRELVKAANTRPEIASVHIAQSCGTCQLRVA